MSYFVRTSVIVPQSNGVTRSGNMPKRILKYKGSAFVVTHFPTKPPVTYARRSRKTGWSADSQRTGIVAQKVGMTMEWDEWGVLRPLTLLKVESNHVIEVKTEAKHGYNALKIGAGNVKLKRMTRAQMGICAHAGVPPKRWLMEFKVTPDAILPVGTKLSAMHFMPGQKVDVIGITKGKGTQGVMKRWGFSGGSASHGNSLAHRIPGSTGQRQDPGRVFPGKKMPGRMGNKKCRMKGLFVYAVYPKKNMIAVIGSVPGSEGGMVKIMDTPWYKFLKPPPFPTWLKSIPKQEVLKTVENRNPWWYEPKIDSPKIMQQIIAGQLDKLEDKPATDQFWARLIKDEVNRQQSHKWPLDLDAKLIEHGKEMIAKTKAETEEAKKAAEASANKLEQKKDDKNADKNTEQNKDKNTEQNKDKKKK